MLFACGDPCSPETEVGAGKEEPLASHSENGGSLSEEPAELPFPPPSSRLGADGPVSAFASDGETLFVGGAFTHLGDQKTPPLAAIDHDGEVLPWPALRSIELSPSVVRSLELLPDGSILAGGATGGTFSARYEVGPEVARHSREPAFEAWAMRLTPAEGGASYDLSVGGRMVDVLAANEQLVAIGGRLALTSFEERPRLAALDVMDGGLLDMAAEPRREVRFLALDEEALYAGGPSLLGHRNDLARVDTTTGEMTPVSLPFDENMKAVTTTGDGLWVIGEHSAARISRGGERKTFEVPRVRTVGAAVGTTDRLFVAGRPLSSAECQGDGFVAIDGGTGELLDWRPLLPVGSRGIEVLAAEDGLIAVGGGLDYAEKTGGTAVMVYSAFGEGFVQPVDELPGKATALAWDDGRLFAAGVTPRHEYVEKQKGYLAVLDLDEGRWMIREDLFDGTVRVLFVAKGRIWLGGSFQTVDGRYQPNLALLSESEVFDFGRGAE